MAESTESKQGDLNTFKDDTDCKVVEKEAINVEKPENEANSTAALIALDIDEDIAKIQAQAIMTVANSMERSVDLGTGEIKQSNLEIETALTNTVERDSNEATSRSMPDRSSRTECQLAAYFAEKTAEDARFVIDLGQNLMEMMATTIDVLKSHIGVYAQKAVEARGRGTERGYSVSDFYTTLVSKYEAAIDALERRYLNVEIAMTRLEDCVDGCVKYAGLAEEITDETLDESRQTKFAACFWNNKGKAAIVVSLKKERAAVYMMRRIWLTARADMEDEDLNRTAAVPEEETDEEIQQQCQNRQRNTTIGHIVSTILGLFLISITVLFKAGSDSFNAILVLGLLTTGWCAVYWSIQLYKCLKKNDRERNTETEPMEEDAFVINCHRCLRIIKSYLRKYSTFMHPDTESDTDSEPPTTNDISL